jgi:hypothetical protein
MNPALSTEGWHLETRGYVVQPETPAGRRSAAG